MYFAKNLRVLRKAKGITQTQAASRLRIKRCSYASYEEGRAEPDLKRALKIASLFGIKIEDMVLYKVTPNVKFKINRNDT